MTFSLTERFAGKIKTREELRDAIGTRPRQQKVIMCHGVFDVVHPGHVRHLLYAKSKAEVLVASLTADQHIDKGKHRPHVPQELRAANLAAYEMVDYVIIDQYERPVENLKFLEPDFFAKGYEYGADGINPRTAEEISVIEEYGGEIIFTPGDFVYSSTKLIDLAPPTIAHEKLVTIMEREEISFETLRSTLKLLGNHKVHVVGDTIIDSLTNCTMIGGQTKTPTISVLYEDRRDFVGGAGVVAKHLCAAGSDVVFSTVFGDDEFKTFALDDLEAAGVQVRPFIDNTRPTTNKNAIVAEGYRLIKIDTLDNRSIGDSVLASLTDTISNVKTDAVVFSDFRHGIFNRRTISPLIEAIPGGCFRVADSQVASRWGNITDFKGFDLITPNEREARFSLADQDSPIRSLASDLYDLAECETLILKLGGRGVLTCVNSNHDAQDSFFTIDSFVDHLVDAVGAGDALLAYGSLTQMQTGSAVQATIIGSLAAACVCEKDGNTPVGPEDLLNKINTIEKKVAYN